MPDHSDIENQHYFDDSLCNISIAILALVSVFSVFFYAQLTKANSRVKTEICKFPGPKSFPIIGSFAKALVPNHMRLRVFQRLVEKYGTTFCMWLGGQPKIIISDPSNAAKILTSFHNVNKNQEYRVLHPWLRTGLLTSSGDKWHSRRKLLTPTFHFEILEDFMDIFNEQGSILVNVLTGEYVDTEKEFDISPFISRCALDIICETAMGKEVKAQVGNDSEYIQSVNSYLEVLLKRMMKPWLHPPMIWKLTHLSRMETKYLKVLHGFTEKVIIERKRDRKMENQKCQVNHPIMEHDETHINRKKKLAFLDLLLDAAEKNDSLSMLDIREEVDTFMFEGHDTTSACFGWTLYLLGRNPEMQRKVQTELDEIFGNGKNRLNTTDTANMKYLECCIKESLRLYPTVPFFGRTIQTDIHLDNGLIAPAGVSCIIYPYLIHRNANFYPDPETFNPDRFLPENCLGRNPYSYIPFSAGYRNCIGQKFALLELKVVLALLLKSFFFEALDEERKLRIVSDLILKPEGGLRFKIYRR